MSTPPGVARRAATRGGFVIAVAVIAALTGCTGSGGSSGSSGSVASSTTSAPPASASTGPKKTPVTIFGGLPPASVPPGGCAPAPRGADATVVVTVNDAGFTPRCVTVATTQTLRLRNVGRLFHNAVVEDLSSNLAPGGSQTWDELGRYLAPGRYLLYSATQLNQSLYPGFHSTLVVEGS
jgi:plastocyanin